VLLNLIEGCKGMLARCAVRAAAMRSNRGALLYGSLLPLQR
jgi:hypothetical protein